MTHSRVIRGMVSQYEPVVMAMATSMEPAPMASIPAAPQRGVWLSVPTSTSPGTL